MQKNKFLDEFDEFDDFDKFDDKNYQFDKVVNADDDFDNWSRTKPKKQYPKTQTNWGGSTYRSSTPYYKKPPKYDYWDDWDDLQPVKTTSYRNTSSTYNYSQYSSYYSTDGDPTKLIYQSPPNYILPTSYAINSALQNRLGLYNNTPETHEIIRDLAVHCFYRIVDEPIQFNQNQYPV